MPRNNINSVEYYLNNYLKNNKVSANQGVPEGSKLNSFVIPVGNSTIHHLNNNNLSNIISQEEEEIPYNITEHQMPLSDEENIIKILKNNDNFQDQTNDIFNLVLSEILYISVYKGMKIYDTNDTSNYFFIINKGSVNLIKSHNYIEKHAHHAEEEKNDNIVNNHKKTFGVWESFGEISFYNGKLRNETMEANENVELYAIDSESFRE